MCICISVGHLAKELYADETDFQFVVIAAKFFHCICEGVGLCVVMEVVVDVVHDVFVEGLFDVLIKI